MKIVSKPMNISNPHPGAKYEWQHSSFALIAYAQMIKLIYLQAGKQIDNFPKVIIDNLLNSLKYS